jgi:hypothetical protein
MVIAQLLNAGELHSPDRLEAIAATMDNGRLDDN